VTSSDATRSRDLQQIDTIDDLERLLAQADAAPVLLYKHSLTCGSSLYAIEQIHALAERTTVPIGLIPVQTARPASNEVASRFGVRHESPQVLVVQGGRVLWHTSHSGVRTDRILAALDKIATLRS
jgi:bacillithiol system protein YtxJ